MTAKNGFSFKMNPFLQPFIYYKYTYHDIVCSMTLDGEVTLLDSFAHTKYDRKKILYFDFIKENSTTEREKVKIDETLCTVVTVGGKFLMKETFKKVLKKIDEIRRLFRV